MSFVEQFPQFEGVNDRIRLLVLQGTPYCNLGCSYCYLSEKERSKKVQMDLEVVEKAAEFLKNSKLLKNELTVLWHAGEPLTVPISYYTSAIEILESHLGSEVNLKFDFQTNAVGLSDRWCEFIKEKDLRIGVSIDGPELIHNAYRITKRGSGSFSRTMAGISMLQKHSIPFGTISVITDQSIKDPENVISFLDSLNSVSIGFNIEEIEGANYTSSIKENDEKLVEFVRRIYSWLDKKGKVNKSREFKSILRTIGSIHLPEHRNRQGENKAFSIITVGYDGSLSTFSPELSNVSDPNYGDFVFGNVDDNIENIIENEKFNKVFLDIESGINRCEKECKYFKYCSGGSPSNKLMENGTFNSTSTQQCWFRKKVFTDVVSEALAKKVFTTCA